MSKCANMDQSLGSTILHIIFSIVTAFLVFTNRTLIFFPLELTAKENTYACTEWELELPEYESGSFSPFMNVNESDLEYTVSMDLPGVNKKDVEVNMSEGMVTVIGERKNSQHGKDDFCIWQENSHGTFKRSFELKNSDILHKSHKIQYPY